MTNSIFNAVEIPKTPFEAGIALYNEPRPEGSADLTEELRNWLLDAGVREEVLQATYDKNRHVNAARTRISIVQRTHLNQFIVLALMTSPRNTIQMRSELLPNGAMADWIDHVKNVIVPFIADNRLLD